MKRDYGAWHSPTLGRTMEYLWFGDHGRPLLLFPTSLGRFWQMEDMGIIEALADKIDAGFIQVVCVDSVDAESWYNTAIPPQERVARHDQYDRYLRHEMVPYIRERARDGNLAAGGASFGAYHAANLAGRYPGVVTKAICLSGLYHVGRYLDGYWGDDCYYHCPVSYIPNMDEEWTGRLRGVEWVVATGEHDTLIQENVDFAGVLWRKGVPAYAEFWQGVFGHDWPWWKDAIRRFI